MEVVDTPLMRVPFEALKRAAKDRKGILDDVTGLFAEPLPSPSTSSSSREQQLEHVNSLISSLQLMKRKLSDVSQTEEEEAHRCKARLQHLKALGPPDPYHAIAWNKQRLDRLLVDHLLRQGASETAELLVSATGIKDLVDLSIFHGARKVGMGRICRVHSCPYVACRPVDDLKLRICKL